MNWAKLNFINAIDVVCQVCMLSWCVCGLFHCLVQLLAVNKIAIGKLAGPVWQKMGREALIPESCFLPQILQQFCRTVTASAPGLQDCWYEPSQAHVQKLSAPELHLLILPAGVL